MRQKKRKPVYRSIRVPLPRQTGGMHKPAKGGKHDRNRAKRDTRRELNE